MLTILNQNKQFKMSNNKHIKNIDARKFSQPFITQDLAQIPIGVRCNTNFN